MPKSITNDLLLIEPQSRIEASSGNAEGVDRMKHVSCRAEKPVPAHREDRQGIHHADPALQAAPNDNHARVSRY